MSGASSVEELEKIIRMAGFCDISIRTEPVSRAYEEKWGGELTVGQYILSAKVFARKCKFRLFMPPKIAIIKSETF